MLDLLPLYARTLKMCPQFNRSVPFDAVDDNNSAGVV